MDSRWNSFIKKHTTKFYKKTIIKIFTKFGKIIKNLIESFKGFCCIRFENEMNDLNREYLPSFESFTNTNVFWVERLKKKMIKIIIIMN